MSLRLALIFLELVNKFKYLNKKRYPYNVITKIAKHPLPWG